MRRIRVQTLACCPTGLFLMLTCASCATVCTAPSDWFTHSATKKPDDCADFGPNCNFHKWSWQMFLWLTQPIGSNGELRFETFAAPSDLFTETDKTLSAHADLPKRTVLRMKPRSTKSEGPQDLGEVNQAGSRGMLVHADGRAVYYSQHINDVFYNFIRDNGYNIPTKYMAASPNQNFPVGALELKASWRIVNAPTPEFYTRTAEIELLVEKDGEILVDPTSIATVTVALVGMHVVGVVKGHPEFIWATFEQKNNAPVLPVGTLPTKPVSSRDWTFYKAGTPKRECNLSGSRDFVLDESTQKLSPVTNAYLQYACGGGSEENTANIKSLNKSVQAKLKPPWNNYELIGDTWILPNTIEPGQSLYPQAVGSSSLSNVTMETFTQTQGNCFMCHTTLRYTGHGVTIPALNMNLSHIMIDGIIQASQKEARARAAALLNP